MKTNDLRINNLRFYLLYLVIRTEIDGKGYRCGYNGEKCSCNGTVKYKNTEIEPITADVDTEFLCTYEESENPSSNSMKNVLNDLDGCWCTPNSKLAGSN